MRIGSPLPIKFFDAPKEGRRATPVNLSFPEDDGKVADFSLIQFQGEQCRIQTLYIDNSANNIALTIQTNTVMQVITVPPQSQGYFPVLSTQPLKLSIFSDGSTSVANIFALNFSVPPACWGISSGSGPASHVIVDSGSIDVANFPAVQPVSQSGVWTIDAAQSGAWSLDINNFPASFGASQVGAWNVAITGTPNVNAAQSGAWNVGITGTPNVNAAQSGTWSFTDSSLPATIGRTVGSSNFTTNFPASVSFLKRVIIIANNLITTVGTGQLIIKDGSGNTVFSKTIGTFSTATNLTLIDTGRMAIPLNNVGNPWSVALTGTVISQGAIEVFVEY